jgi:hypothetical protein
MEMQQHEEVKTTTNYWGYRELSANEIEEVGGGGDFSGTGFGGNTGYGASSYTSYASSQGSNSNVITSAQALALTQLVRGIPGRMSAAEMSQALFNFWFGGGPNPYAGFGGGDGN